jgi:RNA polymerase sigma factor (TIGR02999 family)
MRHILVDQARKKKALKRGAGREREALTSRIEAPKDLADVDLIALDEALESLSAAHERPARIVMLRCFAGADLSEIAKMLEVSESTVDRDWLFARTWLRRALDKS